MGDMNMKTTAVAILSILALAADASAAAVRKSGGAFTTRNGRTVDTPAPAPAPTIAQARRDVALALANPGSGHSSSNDRGGHRSIGAGLRRSGGGEGDQLPPHHTQAGALIRTANPFSYADPKNATTHTVQASAPGSRGFISIDDGKAFDVGRAPGIRQGAKDTLPPPNPSSSGYASGKNSITANSTTINNGAHNNQNGNSGGNGNGNGNGNGFGGGTGFDPSF